MSLFIFPGAGDGFVITRTVPLSCRVNAAVACSNSGRGKKLRPIPAFFLAAFLFAGAQLYAQQPWPGAAGNSGGQRSPFPLDTVQGAGQGSPSGRVQGPADSLRPLPPPPPPPPPPPVNPVFPAREAGQNSTERPDSAGQAGLPSVSGGAASGGIAPGGTAPGGAASGAISGGTVINGNQQPELTESLLLSATEVYPGGNRNLSATDTVSHIFYSAYADQSRSFTVVFKAGLPYTYYLRNPRSIVQMGPELLRISYDTIIQAGNQMVPGFFFSEVYYTNGKPGSLSVVNSSSGAAVVVMNLREAQP
ncbi:MAG: hypothetical protein LBH73_04550 [Spirochaetaceae bacterium]|jgi:hypothetical protein|nr:hypothetical protein [Spirochaetaceae bacterium]